MDVKAEVTANSWCHTARPYRFLWLDGRAAFFLLLWLLYISWQTFMVAFAAMVFFGTLEYVRLPLPIVARKCRAFLAGRKRPGRHPPRLFR